MRGLIHSDGCRTVNRFKTKLPSGRVAEYAYPRYFFSNLSDDIRGLFCEACDALGVRTTLSNPRNVSVSHRKSVAILEEIVGPKSLGLRLRLRPWASPSSDEDFDDDEDFDFAVPAPRLLERLAQRGHEVRHRGGDLRLLRRLDRLALLLVLDDLQQLVAVACPCRRTGSSRR